MVSLSSLRFPQDLCSAVKFSLFLKIKLQGSSSFILRSSSLYSYSCFRFLCQSLIFFLLLLPSFVLFFTFAFFATNLLFALWKISFQIFFSVKKKKKKPVFCKVQSGRKKVISLPVYPLCLLFWHNHQTVVVFQAHHVLE